jgi:GNAT superfamily N-acetyltransferase
MPLRLADATDLDLPALVALFTEAGWSERARDLPAILAGSRFVATAWDDAELVGFGRAFSDGVTGAYLTDVVVRATHRRRGVARALVERLLAAIGDVKVLLHADPHLHAFYAALGFEPAPDLFVRRPGGRGGRSSMR